MLFLFQATLHSFPSIKENLAFFQTLAYCIYFFISMAVSCACLSRLSEAKAAHSCACLHQLPWDSSSTVWTLEAVVPRELFIKLGAFRPRDAVISHRHSICLFVFKKKFKNAVKWYYLYHVGPLIKLVWITSPNVILLVQYKRRCPQSLLSS